MPNFDRKSIIDKVAICAMASFTFLYALNPLISKPEFLTMLVTDKMFKIFILIVAYLLANYFSPLVAILLIASVMFIDADVTVALAK